MIICPACYMMVPSVEAHCCYRRGTPTPVVANPDRRQILQIEDEPLVSNKTKAKRARLHEMLRQGENPFTDVTGLTPEVIKHNATSARARKATRERALQDAEAKEQEHSEALTQRWQSGDGPVDPAIRFRIDSPMANLIGFTRADVGEDPDLTKLRCTYCHKEVSYIEATRGHGKGKIKVVQEVVEIDHKPEIVERKVYSAEKITACPACAHKIKPVTDKDGKLVNSGLDIPNSD